MQNEFYAVELIDDESVIINGDENFHFFRRKDNAFKFLWQQFLNAFADKYTEEDLLDIKEAMYEYYGIDGFGSVHVIGFED